MKLDPNGRFEPELGLRIWIFCWVSLQKKMSETHVNLIFALLTGVDKLGESPEFDALLFFLIEDVVYLESERKCSQRGLTCMSLDMIEKIRTIDSTSSAFRACKA